MAGIAIALSGGGHRASLFGLGALLYLADAGSNTRVTSIASVSGGSITNGYVGQQVDYSTVDGPEFAAAMRPLARRIARRGTVQWAWQAVALLAVLIAATGLAVAAWFLPVPGWARVVIFAVALAVLFGAFGARSVVADRALRGQLFRRDGKPTPLADLAADPVEHVLCATDLQSGRHLYLSGRWIYGYDVGQGMPGALPLSMAVQCSACLPGAFPPRRLPARRYGLAAKTLWLTDGGTYDNMADQWAVGLTGDTGHRPPDQTPPDELIVVNASARGPFRRASWLTVVPVVGELLSLLRVKDAMYEATTATRRRSLVAGFEAAAATGTGLRGALVHIGTSPDFVTTVTGGPKREARAKAVAAALSDLSREEIAARVTRSRGAPTTLARLGPDTAAATLWHGYTLAMAVLHVYTDHPLLEVPTLDRFQTMTA